MKKRRRKRNVGRLAFGTIIFFPLFAKMGVSH